MLDYNDGRGKKFPGPEATDVKLPSAVIETFLRSHRESFCVDCLAQGLDMPAGQVSMVVRRLQDTLGFSVATGPCSLCRRQRSVIRAAAAG
jgi:hypothetical protein